MEKDDPHFFLRRLQKQKLRDRLRRKLTCFIVEVGILILLHVLGRSALIQEQRVNPSNVLHLNLCPLRKTEDTT